MNEPVPVPLARLRANEDYQPRVDGIDERHVRLLMATDPTTWPPLGVTPNDIGGFDVFDGFTRYEVGRRKGLAELLCVVVPGAGYPEAFAANLAHGLPLSLEDRKAYARWVREEEPGLSLREIGRRCGLHHETVRKALEGGEEPATGGQNRQASPDPIPRLVGQVVRAYDGGHGRTWFGLGRDGSPKPFRAAIDTYAEDDRPAVARALAAFGRACVAAAAPFVGGDEG
jgi:hypothetical protein